MIRNQWENTDGEPAAETTDGARPEAEDQEREPEAAETTEVLDDPVRMYLREIGRVRLLTSADERKLARQLEGGKHLNAVKSELTEELSQEPQPLEISARLLRRLSHAEPLIYALAQDFRGRYNDAITQFLQTPPTPSKNRPRRRRRGRSQPRVAGKRPRRQRCSAPRTVPIRNSGKRRSKPGNQRRPRIPTGKRQIR